MTSARQQFIEFCEAQKGKPYIWGGKGPNTFDCSGIVTAGLFACGWKDWRQTHNSARLFEVLEPVQIAELGDLAFYGPPNKITHVMVCWHGGGVYGASGGNSSTTKPTAGAAVKFKKSVDYRRDFRGFRKNPLSWESLK